LLLVLLFYSLELDKTILVLGYDDDLVHEAIEHASHETYTEKTMLSTVSQYIAGHKFFAYDPRNGQVGRGADPDCTL